MLPRRQENFRWKKKFRKSNEVVTYLRTKSRSLYAQEEDIIAAAPCFTIIDENDDEDVNIED